MENGAQAQPKKQMTSVYVSEKIRMLGLAALRHRISSREFGRVYSQRFTESIRSVCANWIRCGGYIYNGAQAENLFRGHGVSTADPLSAHSWASTKQLSAKRRGYENRSLRRQD